MSFLIRSWTLILAGLLLCTPGCKSGKQKEEGRVSGKVTYQGLPLTEGDVNLYFPESGMGAMVPVGKDGTFTVPEPLLVGTYEVFVTPPVFAPNPDGPNYKPTGAIIIPKKARDPKTSGLSIDVKKGRNEVLLELTD